MKAFIISVVVSLGGASLVLAQVPDRLLTIPVSSWAPARENSPQERAGAPKGKAESVPSSGIPGGQGTSCDLDLYVVPCVDGQRPFCDGGPCSAGGKVCGPPARFWVGAEYLLWWLKGPHLPPLVTTGPANPAQSPPPGAPGAPGTAVLFGDNNLEQGAFSGMRFAAGLWLNECQTFGVEGSFFSLASRSNNVLLGSTGAAGSPVVARPFFDVSTGQANSELIAFPGLASGTVAVQSSSRLLGAGTNFLCNLCCSCADCCDCCQPCGGYRVDLIGGARYLDLREGLGIAENIQVLPGSPALPGSTILAFDQFDTRNQFYGGQIGARASWYRDRLFANVTGTIALGTTHQTVDVNGSTTITPPGGPATVVPGAFLALPSNAGHFTRDRFSIVPEVGLNVGYQITNNLSAFVGYNFLYWSSVVRPGDQINLGVNSTHTPASLLPPNGRASPLFTFRGSDFWAQGVSFGAQLVF